jgi:Mrp family chromosome partitioning ATPase
MADSNDAPPKRPGRDELAGIAVPLGGPRAVASGVIGGGATARHQTAPAPPSGRLVPRQPVPAALAARTPVVTASATAGGARPSQTDISVEPELIRVERIPPSDDGRDGRLVLRRAPDSPAAASFRVLRQRVIESGARVLMITSAGRRDGKTTLALNLALALAESRRPRVLLVEANLRHPAVARALGFRPTACFGEQLELHRTYPQQPWIVVENGSEFLHILAVKPDQPPQPIVDGLAVGIALEQLRASHYQHIIFDCPPVLGSADVNLLEPHMDGVLLAVRARMSRSRDLRRAIQQMGSRRIIGTALID